MSSTGLLVVSNVKQIGKTLRALGKNLNALYIHLNIPAAKIQPVPTWGRLISQLYIDSATHCGTEIDMRILVGPLKMCSNNTLRLKPIDMIFSDSHEPEVCEPLRKQLNIPGETIYLQKEATSDIINYKNFDQTHNVYGTVVLGGTFDRIHLGHKIFLTQAVLRACDKLVVGVTTSNLTKSKILNELILPVEQRISDVKEFLTEIDPSIQYDVVPIDDPFGPTKSDPDMDLIVVSAETLRGGQKVNELRTKNNLRQLEIYCVDMVNSNEHNDIKEPKISSSNTRIDLLGTRIRQPSARQHLSMKPYIIGLTGGIASGKSIMAQRLRDFGAVVLDCDKIAHEIYEPNQVCYNKIHTHFGQDILSDSGHIDRKKLGAIVFGNSQKLEILNGIVWPELLIEVKRRIRAIYAEQRPDVIVIEAAVLFKAGWESECHEIWGMIIPHEDAVKRVMTRNNLTKEEAVQRLASQVSNTEVVAKSNVVFSSQWDLKFTQSQAEKAWAIIKNDMENRTKNSML